MVVEHSYSVDIAADRVVADTAAADIVYRYTVHLDIDVFGTMLFFPS
jgi:hypothetical protein